VCVCVCACVCVHVCVCACAYVCMHIGVNEFSSSLQPHALGLHTLHLYLPCNQSMPATAPCTLAVPIVSRAPGTSVCSHNQRKWSQPWRTRAHLLALPPALVVLQVLDRLWHRAFCNLHECVCVCAHARV